eukprot:5773-Heterococcus_DN1.PRE.5
MVPLLLHHIVVYVVACREIDCVQLTAACKVRTLSRHARRTQCHEVVETEAALCVACMCAFMHHAAACSVSFVGVQKALL